MPVGRSLARPGPPGTPSAAGRPAARRRGGRRVWTESARPVAGARRRLPRTGRCPALPTPGPTAAVRPYVRRRRRPPGRTRAVCRPGGPHGRAAARPGTAVAPGGRIPVAGSSHVRRPAPATRADRQAARRTPEAGRPDAARRPVARRRAAAGRAGRRVERGRRAGRRRADGGRVRRVRVGSGPVRPGRRAGRRATRGRRGGRCRAGAVGASPACSGPGPVRGAGETGRSPGDAGETGRSV